VSKDILEARSATVVARLQQLPIEGGGLVLVESNAIAGVFDFQVRCRIAQHSCCSILSLL